MGLELCGVCGENETGRLIEGIPVCGRCFIEGGLNLPKNQKILKKVYDSPYKESEPEALGETQQEAKPLPKGMFWCSRCHGPHRKDSKVGKRHLKYEAKPGGKEG